VTDEKKNLTTSRRRKLTALPLLIVLFVISYCLLTRLVIEQDKTIDSQRSLIHLLFKDNVSLSMKHKHAASLPKGDVALEFPDTHKAAPSGKTSQAPSDQVQSDQAQSDQVQLGQFPSFQVYPKQAQPGQAPQSNATSQANTKADRKTRKAVKPPTPPVQLTDPTDMRRVTFSI
jgi:nucleoid DNA-binding protein